MKVYELQHIVGFEETNLVGNVYYANFVRWQGRCREMFLHDHAPDILNELQNGLFLVTVRVSCEYFNELYALDTLVIRMRIGDITQNRITMLFDYNRVAEDGETIIARGEQQVACMGKQNNQLHPVPIPDTLQLALALFSGK